MGKQRVLLVDDEIDFQAVMRMRIESWGYEVITADSGKEALAQVKDRLADIVVLDYMMPGLDGISTLEEIRKIDPKIPVIMFTAFPDSRSLKGTEKLGVSAFIPKLNAFSDNQAALQEAIRLAGKKMEKDS